VAAPWRHRFEDLPVVWDPVAVLGDQGAASPDHPVAVGGPQRAGKSIRQGSKEEKDHQGDCLHGAVSVRFCA